jgi:hypothetical protein
VDTLRPFKKHEEEKEEEYKKKKKKNNNFAKLGTLRGSSLSLFMEEGHFIRNIEP